MLDDGYFPYETSMLRRVMEHRAVGAHYGQRALCIGALAPLNYIGTARHTRQLNMPFKRLVRTAKGFEAIIFGSREEADRVLAMVRRMHERVNGELPEAAGPYPAGTPYDALDPSLMLWTVALMMDSAEVFHDLLVRRLRSHEREHLWQDYIHFAGLFGMPRDAAPPSYRDFREYFDGRLASGEMFLTPEARHVGYCTAFEIPFPRKLAAFKPAHDLVLLGSLPSSVRRAYGLRFTPLQRAAFNATVRAMRSGRIAVPRSMARGRCTWLFDGVAATERYRLATGRPTPGISPDGELLGPSPRRMAA